MASDITKNEGDIENYSKEFLELQKQLNQMYHEKFNGISLFSMSRSERLTNPPDLRPTLDKNNLVKDTKGRGYQSFSRNIVTTADGLKQDGNISLNTVNLQYMLSLGGLDSTFITKTAAAILAAQQSNTEQTGNTDGSGQRSFINIGNVNGANSGDWTDNSISNAIIDTIYNNDDAIDAKTFAAGPFKVGDYAKDANGLSYKVTKAADVFSATTNYSTGDVVYNPGDGTYYQAVGSISTPAAFDSSGTYSNAAGAVSDVYNTADGNYYRATGAIQATPTAWSAVDAAAGYNATDQVYNSADGKYYEAGAAIQTPGAWTAGTAPALNETVEHLGSYYAAAAGAVTDGAGVGNDPVSKPGNWTLLSGDPAQPGHADSHADWNELAGNPAQPGHADSDANWSLLADNPADPANNSLTTPNPWNALTVTELADLTTAGGLSVNIFEEADKFTSQAEIDTYMNNEIYTEDNLIRSIMFVDMATFNDLIERVADARAENGAEQNRLGMINELLTQNQTNLEAAHGRIMDADVALESTRFARQNVLVQSSAAMVAQANQLTNIALTILG